MPLLHRVQAGLCGVAAKLPGMHIWHLAASVPVLAHPAGHVLHQGCCEGGTGHPVHHPTCLGSAQAHALTGLYILDGEGVLHDSYSLRASKCPLAPHWHQCALSALHEHMSSASSVIFSVPLT